MLIKDMAKCRYFKAFDRTNLCELLHPAREMLDLPYSIAHAILEPGAASLPHRLKTSSEVYFILEGEGEMCLGSERLTMTSGQTAYIPSGVFHQLTNIGATPLKMIYCYGPAGNVAHWRQELDGTLPKAGVEAPPLPPGAQPQHIGGTTR